MCLHYPSRFRIGCKRSYRDLCQRTACNIKHLILHHLSSFSYYGFLRLLTPPSYNFLIRLPLPLVAITFSSSEPYTYLKHDTHTYSSNPYSILQSQLTVYITFYGSLDSPERTWNRSGMVDGDLRSKIPETTVTQSSHRSIHSTSLCGNKKWNSTSSPCLLKPSLRPLAFI